ncbi:MAG: hypothetical protein K5917_05950 [Clostridiales bacterium]|nr:hypothetical protein [Clostridiales bacterium]
MSMRITSSMISKQYKKNANEALNTYNDNADRSTTHRAFSRTSEDIFSATKAFKVRNEIKANNDYIANAANSEDFLDTGEKNIQTINKIIQDVQDKINSAITGTKSADERSIIATELRTMRESIVSTLNTQYADQYIFGGSDTSKAPFSVVNDELYYRGINVNTGESLEGAATNVGATVIKFGESSKATMNNSSIVIKELPEGSPADLSYDSSTGTITVSLAKGSTNADLEQALKDGFNGGALSSAFPDVVADEVSVQGLPSSLVTFSALDASNNPVASSVSNKANLKNLAEENVFVDIGLGLDFNKDGTVNEQSVFDISMSGISFLGYGQDSDGTHQNIYSLIGDMADYLESSNFTTDGSYKIKEAISDGYNSFLKKYTEFGSRSSMISYTKDYLDDKDLNLTEKQDDIEFVDAIDAYIDLMTAKTAYMAAIQIGTNIIQPTVLDFMK